MRRVVRDDRTVAAVRGGAPAHGAGRGQGTTRGVGLPYLPGLDGLRALAVLAVLLYHAELTWLPGGFLGVEVFFVISGYLITALLLTEWRQLGRVDLKGFWIRRARRLLPALYLLLALTLAYAVVFLPGEVAGLRGDVIAALDYVTNWYLVLGHESYFEAIGRPSLLKHLWSLAVEEQFYLLWPPVLALGDRPHRQQRHLYCGSVRRDDAGPRGRAPGGVRERERPARLGTAQQRGAHPGSEALPERRTRRLVLRERLSSRVLRERRGSPPDRGPASVR